MRYGLSFVATAFIAKIYGPEIFGTYQLAITYLAILDFITFLNPLHIRNHLVRNPEDESKIVSVWKLHHIIISIFIVIVVVFCWWRAEYPLVYAMLMWSLPKIFFRIWDYQQIILDAKLRGDLVQKIQIISAGSFNIARIAIAFFKANPVVLSGATLIQSIVTFLYQRKLLLQNANIVKTTMSYPLLKQLIREGWMLTVMTFLVGIQGRIVSLVLVERMSPSDYGNFQLVFKLVEPATMIATVLFGANYTALANTLENAKTVFFKRFFKVSALVILSSIGCAVGLVVIPANWWVMLFGEAYREGLEYLWMGMGLVISGVLFSLSVQMDVIALRYISACMKNILVIIIYLIAALSLSEASVTVAMILYSVVPIAIVVLFLPFDIIKIRKIIG